MARAWWQRVAPPRELDLDRPGTVGLFALGWGSGNADYERRLMRLPEDDRAALEARRLARRWAAHEGVSERVVGDLELVVTELVTNAVRHGLPPYDFGLRRDGGIIRGEVCDALPLSPHSKEHPDESGGFGLGIVNACVDQWGTQTLPTGKKVWFEIKP